MKKRGIDLDWLKATRPGGRKGEIGSAEGEAGGNNTKEFA